MGNDHSRGGNGGYGGKGKGVVVVRDGTVIKTEDPDDDVDLKRLKEMPRFLPILRGSIGRRDICEHRAISPRPFLQLSLRLSNHLSLCAKAVSTKQTHLTGMIKTVDGRVVEVTNELMGRKKKLDRFVKSLGRVKEINQEIQKAHIALDSLLKTVDELNHILPMESRLPPLSIPRPSIDNPPSTVSSPCTSSPSPLSSSSSTPSHHPSSSSRDSPRRLPPIDEVKVIDKVINPKR